MAARFWKHRSVLLSLAIVLATVGWMAASMTRAAELDKLDASLKLIPDDAAFYSTMLRNREQFELLRKSNAWAKVENMPIVQMGLAFYKAQLNAPGSQVAGLNEAMKNPEVAKIVDLLGDMVSDEVFAYGDDSCIEFTELMQKVSNATRFAPMVLQVTGKGEKANEQQLQGKVAISVLAKNAQALDVPNFVIGFKVKNADLAKEQLIKLEMFGNMLAANEKLKDAFKKTKVGGQDYLVLSLDGEMIPWDQVPMDKFAEWELEKGDVQKVVDKLKESNLVIALGIRDKYLLLSIGSSLECLEQLGQGKRLIDRAEFKPLAKFVDKRLTSIGYLSDDLNEQLNDQMGQIDKLVETGDKLLPLAKLTEQQNERIRKDAKALVKDIKSLVPDLGPVMGFAFLTEQGVEHYQYAWGDHERVDGSKPLGILQHVGGNPILGCAARGKVEPEVYDGFVRWLKVGYGYFEEFGLPNIEPKVADKLKPFLASAKPLLERLDKANREMLIPALADGQSALVIDAKLQSKHFIASLPATENPMPMLEPAFLLGVSDAELLKKGLGEYRQVINGLIDAARKVEGSDIPANIQIPEPQTTESALGTIYSFPLPKEWGVDAKIVPNLGIAKDVFVVSTSKEHTERLLKPTPLSVGGTLAKTDRPLAMAAWFDWAALLNTATPWVDFGVAQAAASKGGDPAQQKEILSQVHTGIEVLKALKAVTSEAYMENDVMVRHTLTEIHDVAK